MTILQRYPEAEPFNQFSLPVSKHQNVHVREYGNPQGYPVVHLHGGPGAGCFSEYRLFDPSVFHVTLIDQPGCGLNTLYGQLQARKAKDPSLDIRQAIAGKSVDEVFGSLRDLSMDHLVAAVEKVREAVGVQRWAVSGGSFGTYLAMRYAEQHPERISRMLLRAVFTGDQKGATNISEYGSHASIVRPAYWPQYAEWPALNNPASLIDANYKIAAQGKMEDVIEGAIRFMKWDNSIALPDYNTDVINSAETDLDVSLYRQWFHFTVTDFMTHKKSPIFGYQKQIGNMPIEIVHGAQDWICPREGAENLAAAYRNVHLNIIEGAGHSGGDPKIIQGLLEVTEDWKQMFTPRLAQNRSLDI